MLKDVSSNKDDLRSSYFCHLKFKKINKTKIANFYFKNYNIL